MFKNKPRQRTSKLRGILFLSSISIVVVVLLLGCSTKSGLPSQYTNDSENLKRAIILLNEARDLSNPPRSDKQSTFTLSKEVEDEIYSKTEDGIRFGKQVSDEYLDHLHPELKDMFKNKLIRGTDIWYQGIKDNQSGRIGEGVQKQIQGDELVAEWIEWWDKQGKTIADKVYGD